MAQRADIYLTQNGYFESRNRAIEALKSKRVTIDGKIAKPSTKVSSNSTIKIDIDKFYVSRAAIKLEGFLDEIDIEIEGKKALDIGSSTGGFAQILLERGVKSLCCVDVGKNQLHRKVREDSRVEVNEGCDIRDFKRSGFDLISCDLSFISTISLLDRIDRLINCGHIIILFKPQFEVGVGIKRDKRGVVVDKKAIEAKQKELIGSATKLKWRYIYSNRSKLSGKDGNVEYLYLFYKGK